jgi:uncharacterized protein (TIGR02246 family)
MERLQPTKPTSLDIEAIQTLLTNFAKGWNTHDSSKFAQVFEEDADFTNVMGIGRNGRAAIEALHAPMFKTIWAFSTLSITETKIRFIKPDVAAVDARWILDGLKDEGGNDRSSRQGLLNVVMTKKNGQWMITIMHNMDLPNSVVQNC